MKIETLIKQIEDRAKNRRTYTINPKFGFISLELEYDQIYKRAFSHSHNRPRVDFDKLIYTCSDLYIKGTGGHRDLGKKWGINLPMDFLVFSNFFRNYMLAGCCSVRIDDASSVEELTTGLRQASDIAENAPHRLYYFATITGHPGNFAFRWSKDLAKMDIVIIRDYVEIDESELLGSRGDSYVTDQSFTEWLARMLQTDGWPLVPGDFDFLQSGLKRLT